MLRDEMLRYEQITGESAEHIPIMKLGAFLDGYDMAIKALEQESCDCISREQALKALGEAPYVWTDCDAELQAYEDWRTIKEMLEGLPSVAPKESKTDRLCSYLNDMRFGIAPDETTPSDERDKRLTQIEIIDCIMEWIEKESEE